MINPYFCRYEKNLYYILSEENSAFSLSLELQEQTIIVMNLFYMDTLGRFLKYLKNIPDGIQVIVVSSKKELLDKTIEYTQKNNIKNVQLVQKDNRGRDLSAFLVACRKEILKYKYFCFVHDKKTGLKEIDEETNFWIDNLWDNTLKSGEYIANVLQIFEKESHIGLLVPPEPIGELRSHWFMNNWGRNFDTAKEMAEKLEIQCNMDANIPVITLGTVFWSRTCALNKMLKYEWDYDEFPDEPMPIDGTVSHALERLLAFAAQDAGYETGTIMCNSYAEKLMGILQYNMFNMFGVLRNIAPIKNIKELTEISRIESFYNCYKHIYLYGAGKVGKQCLKIMRSINCEPDGFLVTQKKEGEDTDNIPVIGVEQLDVTDDVGVIITVGKRYKEDIENVLKDKGIKNYMFFV